MGHGALLYSLWLIFSGIIGILSMIGIFILTYIVVPITIILLAFLAVKKINKLIHNKKNNGGKDDE